MGQGHWGREPGMGKGEQTETGKPEAQGMMLEEVELAQQIMPTRSHCPPKPGMESKIPESPHYSPVNRYLRNQSSISLIPH